MNSRDKIIRAAIRVFAERGRYGARMEEIAAEAGVNKAMLYYYYSSKENLYREVLTCVFTETLGRVFAGLDRILAGSKDFTGKVQALSSLYFDVFSEKTSNTRILFEALAGQPGEVRRVVQTLKAESDFIRPGRILEIFREAVSEGKCREVDPRQIVISLIGMNIIYFLARPIAEVLLDLDERNRQAFLGDREQSVIDMLLHGLLKEKDSGV